MDADVAGGVGRARFFDGFEAFAIVVGARRREDDVSGKRDRERVTAETKAMVVSGGRGRTLCARFGQADWWNEKSGRRPRRE